MNDPNAGLASWADAAAVTMYSARYADKEAATHAAELILRHDGWMNFGGPELAILAADVGGEDGLWWICDLSEVPEARPHAVAVVGSTTTDE